MVIKQHIKSLIQTLNESQMTETLIKHMDQWIKVFSQRWKLLLAQIALLKQL